MVGADVDRDAAQDEFHHGTVLCKAKGSGDISAKRLWREGNPAKPHQASGPCRSGPNHRFNFTSTSHLCVASCRLEAREDPYRCYPQKSLRT